MQPKLMYTASLVENFLTFLFVWQYASHSVAYVSRRLYSHTDSYSYHAGLIYLTPKITDKI